MKKIISLVMVLVMATAVFSACGSKSSDSKSGGDGKQVLSMATNAEFPPYEYVEGEDVVGIDVDIAQAIADKLGMELKVDNMNFDSIIPAITSGKDAIGVAGMTVTDERKKNVDFTDSYATGVQVVIVREDSKIKDVKDLTTKGADNTIGVQLGTTGDIYCTSDIQDKGFGKVQQFNKGADAVQALVSGKIDCVVIDNQPAKEFVKANKGLKILDTEYVTEDYAIAVAKDNTELKDKINGALNELKADGTIQKILDKYIKAK